MSNIDYKAEVRNVFPLAYINWSYTQEKWIIFNAEYPFILGKAELMHLAWQNAYEQLKKEGKIK